MASKKFRRKTCAYCGVPGSSTTGDHVFARKFLLEHHRANLPVVPSCARCNSEKSKLETYLLQVLPLGANHPDAAETGRTLMRRRAAHHSSKVLREILERPQGAVWLTDQMAQRQERIPVYIDANRLHEWCGLVARGLAFFHWGRATPDYLVETIALSAEGESNILGLVAGLRNDNGVARSVGNGAFQYRGFKEVDGALSSMWLLSLYGRMAIGGDSAVSQAFAASWGVFITPRGRQEAA